MGERGRERRERERDKREREKRERGRTGTHLVPASLIVFFARMLHPEVMIAGDKHHLGKLGPERPQRLLGGLEVTGHVAGNDEAVRPGGETPTSACGVYPTGGEMDGETPSKTSKSRLNLTPLDGRGGS